MLSKGVKTFLVMALASVAAGADADDGTVEEKAKGAEAATPAADDRLGAQIELLWKEARSREKQGDYDASLRKYDEMLALNEKRAGSPDQIRKKLEILIARRDTAVKKANRILDSAEYVKHVRLHAFEARYYDTGAKTGTPGVKFKIRNDGRKTLNEIEVTVYFKDKDGNTIAAIAYKPVTRNTDSPIVNHQPLEQGALWQLEKGTFLPAWSVPPHWVERAAVARITGLEIAD
jgi:hypothetical protein